MITIINVKHGGWITPWNVTTHALLFDECVTTYIITQSPSDYDLALRPVMNNKRKEIRMIEPVQAQAIVVLPESTAT
jgi:hypothetical protein